MKIICTTIVYVANLKKTSQMLNIFNTNQTDDSCVSFMIKLYCIIFHNNMYYSYLRMCKCMTILNAMTISTLVIIFTKLITNLDYIVKNNLKLLEADK